jgi:hypothetical protein
MNRIKALKLDAETGHQEDHQLKRPVNCKYRCITKGCTNKTISKQSKVILKRGKYVGYCGGHGARCWDNFCKDNNWDYQLSYAANLVAEILELSPEEKLNINESNIQKKLNLSDRPFHNHISFSRRHNKILKRKINEDLPNIPNKRPKRKIINQEEEELSQDLSDIGNKIPKRKMIEEELSQDLSDIGNKRQKLNSWSDKFNLDIQRELIKIKEDHYFRNHQKIKYNDNETDYKILEIVKNSCRILYAYTIKSNKIIDQIKNKFENDHNLDIVKEFRVLWNRNNPVANRELFNFLINN